MENKLVSDTTFKFLLKNDKTRNWFLELIKGITNIDLNNYLLVDPYYNSGTSKIKDYIVDIKFEKEKHTVIIELQNLYSKSAEIKNYQYLFREAGIKFSKGDVYKDNKTTLICFNNYITSGITDKEPIKYELRSVSHGLIKEDIQSYEISIPNYRKIDYNKSTRSYQKLYILGLENFDELNNISLNDEDKTLIKELEVLNMDKDYLEAYELELANQKLINSNFNEGIEEGIEKGIEKGIEQGKNSSRKEIALKMLNEKFEISTISKLTSLSIKEINELKKDI